MDLEQRLREGPLKVREVWSGDQTSRLAANVVRLRRRRSVTRAALGMSAVLCAAGAAVLLPRDPISSAETAARAPGSEAQSTRGPVPQAPLVLRDGSRAEPETPGSRLRVLRDRPERVSLELQRGGARFAVVPNPERRFEVEAGAVLVRVKGTTFTVTRTGATTRVVVEDGRVQVLWAGEQVELTAGQSGVYPPADPAEQFEQAQTEEARAPSRTQAAAHAQSWRELAQRGEYGKAYPALRRARARVLDLPEDHMLAADVARLSGHPRQAVPHLRAVAQRFRDDPRAPVAAFTLGRVLLHDLKRPRDAARAFHHARRLWPRGPLALDAWASEAEALREAGDTAPAAELAAGYLKQHPQGRHAQAMRALLASD